MGASPLPSSEELAHYLEQRGELGKPWMWHLLRQAKVREARGTMPPEQMIESIQGAHADRYAPSTAIEPLPGSPDDR